MSGLKPFLLNLSQGKEMSGADAEKAFDVIMSGEASQAQIGAFLMALHMRGESIEEITAAARVMRSKAVAIESPDDAVDTCGTGGDASGTYNISTAAAIVVAAAGVPVAKHGNRSQSSTTGSGSAEVLSALGVMIDADYHLVKKGLWENNIGFMMAPRHHVAMRHVASIRSELGIRTLFNLLGPLSNPAGTKRQLLGVFSRQWVEPLAYVLGRLGARKAWVVHGSDGIDELTTTGISYVSEWNQGKVNSFTVSPADAGLAIAKPESLKGGGNVQENADALRAILERKKNAYRDIVLLNSGATLLVADKVANLAEGVKMAAEAIDSGRARITLDRMIAISHGK